jgi:hypothetical protein
VLVMVTSLCIFAVSRRIELSLVALAFVGGAQMIFRTTAMALIHEGTEDSHRGRVVSIFLLDYGLWAFGTLWLGLLCKLHGPTFAVLVGALSCLAVVALIAAFARRRQRASEAALAPSARRA